MLRHSKHGGQWPLHATLRDPQGDSAHCKLELKLNEIQNNTLKLCNRIFSVPGGVCIYLWRQNNGQQIRALEWHHHPDIFAFCFCSVIS